MKAIVCDSCGRVPLLEDNAPYVFAPAGTYVLAADGMKSERLDLCEGCVKKLMKAVRGEEEP